MCIRDRLCTGLDWLLDDLETNAPESWARIEQTRPYEVRFEENIDASCTDVYKMCIRDRRSSSPWTRERCRAP